CGAVFIKSPAPINRGPVVPAGGSGTTKSRSGQSAGNNSGSVAPASASNQQGQSGTGQASQSGTPVTTPPPPVVTPPPPTGPGGTAPAPMSAEDHAKQE